MMGNKQLRIMTEASGCLTSGYMMKAIRAAGHIPIGSDINPWTAALGLADGSMVLPPHDAPELWETMEGKLFEYGIDVVIPTLDKTLLGWAERLDHFSRLGITVILSPAETVKTFLDKWFTYQFFRDNGIPCPATSLCQEYPLIKPRCGSGAKGIFETAEKIDMTGHISQAVIKGTEYTVDCLFDRQGDPIYIIPRLRLLVRDGKSTHGEVVDVPAIEPYIRKMAKAALFAGPVNFQCFQDEQGRICFIEVNPRLAGGMALAFAATENWVSALIGHFLYHEPIRPKPVKFGTRMIRYYAEHFVYPS